MEGRRNKGLLLFAGVLGLLILIAVVALLKRPSAVEQVALPAQVELAQNVGTVQDKAPEAAAETAPESATESGTSESEATAAAAAGENASEAPVPALTGRETHFHGRVTSKATGEPIAGAAIMLYGGRAMFAGPGNQEPQAKVESDKEGFYRFDTEVLESAMGTGSILRAEAHGFTSRAAMLLGGRGDKERRTDFILDYGGTIEGRIVNEDKQPVAEVTIGNLIMEQPNMEAMLQGLPVMLSTMTKSDSSGNFVLTGVPEGKPTRLPVRAENYLPMITDPLEAGAKDVEIVVRRGEARMHGKVFDHKGNTVAGATLLSFPADLVGSFAVTDVMGLMQSTTTNNDGDYVFEALPAGLLQVQVLEGMDKLIPQNIDERIQLSKGQDLEKDFRFFPPIVVKGHALDSKTKEGIAGVKLSAKPYGALGLVAAPESGQVHDDEVISAADGSFEIAAAVMGGGNAAIYFDPPEGWINESMMPYNMYFFTHSKTGDPHEANLMFHRGANLRGTVVDAGGAPVADAEIKVNRSSGQGGFGMPTPGIKSDAEGKFSTTIDFSATVTVDATAPQGFARADVTAPADGDPDPIELKLEKFATISGTVKNNKGEGLSGVSIKALAATDARINSFMTEIAATTDANGYYLADRVPPGEVNVTALPTDDSGYTASEPRKLTLQSGGEERHIDFVLKTGDYIKGTITDEDDKPVAGATIMPVYQGESPGRVNASSGADGKYELRGLPIDRQINYLMVFHAQYEQQMRENVSIFDGVQDFKLKRIKSLELYVEDSGSGNPIPHYEYQLSSRQGSGFMVMPYTGGVTSVNDAQGHTTIQQVRSGEWRLEVAELNDENNQTGRRGTLEFTWPSGDTNEMRVPIAGGRKVTGRIVMKDSQLAVEDAVIQLSSPSVISFNAPNTQDTNSFFKVAPANSDRQGRFTLEGVPAGTHALKVTKDDLQPTRKVQVTVSLNNDPEPLVIEMITVGAIYGRVIGFDGAPVANATVTSVESQVQNPSPNTGTTNANGEYRIEGLAAGSHTVSYGSGADALSRSHTVTLAAGEEKELNFDFSTMIEISGTITRAGKPLPQNQFVSFYIRQMQSTRDEELIGPSRMTRTADGGYKIYVPAGEYYVQDVVGTGIRAAVADITVAEQPRQLRYDINIQLADTDMIIVMPEGEKFTPGKLILKQRGPGGHIYSTQDIALMSSQKRLSLCAFGEYSARYVSEDNKLSGESEWTKITPGAENVIVIDVGGNDVKRIGGWDTHTITTENKAHSFPASEAVRSAANYEIIVDFDEGMHGVNIEGLSLLLDGQVIASDNHIGWTGLSNRNNVYQVTVRDYRPGNYTVEVHMRSDGGTMSKGSVFMAKGM